MSQYNKDLAACRKRVFLRDNQACVVIDCDDNRSNVWSHILSRGAHKEFAAKDFNSVTLCVLHDRIMDALYPTARRIPWLRDNADIDEQMAELEAAREAVKL